MTISLPSSSSRFGTFFSRVETERTVLSIINQPDMDNVTLSGLTEAAIDRWHMEIDGCRASSLVSTVVKLLHRISVRAGVQADQSRVVFANETHVTLPIDDLVSELRTACAEWRLALRKY